MIEKLLSMLVSAILNWMAASAKKEIERRLDEVAKGKADAEINETNVANYNKAVIRSEKINAALDLLNGVPHS